MNINFMSFIFYGHQSRSRSEKKVSWKLDAMVCFLLKQNFTKHYKLILLCNIIPRNRKMRKSLCTCVKSVALESVWGINKEMALNWDRTLRLDIRRNFLLLGWSGLPMEVVEIQSRDISLGVSLGIVPSVSTSLCIICLNTSLYSHRIPGYSSCTINNTKCFHKPLNK